MVRNFKGVVKVADVQEEFDNLLNTINAKIDEYNSSLNIEDIDYNNGGPDLAPYGYTLSVGGLKKVLNAYDRAILGANILRLSNGVCVVSEGLYIKDGEVIKLPSKVVEGDGKSVYYHPESETYDFYERPIINRLTLEGCKLDGNTITPDAVADRGSYIRTSNAGFSGLDTGYYQIIGDESSNKLGSTYIMMPFENKYIYTFPCENSMYAHDVLLGFFNGNGEWQTVIEIPSLNYSVHSTTSGNRASAVYYPTSAYSSSYSNGRYSMSGGKTFNGVYSNANEYSTQLSNIPVGKIVLQVNASSGGFGLYVFTGLWVESWQKYGYRSEYQYISSIGDDYNKITHIVIIPDEGMVTNGTLNKEYYGMYRSDTVIANSPGGVNDFLNDAVNLLEVEDPIEGLFISRVNTNRISRLCNRPNAINESIPDYKVTIESKNSGYVINGNQYLSNSDKGQFYSGSAGRNCRINLFDTQVAYHQWHGDRTDSYHEPFNFMFIPKGIPNPYNGLAGEVRFAMQKVWNYILQRPSR